MPFSEVIKACLLQSANETANIIAENSASSREEFLKLMNKKAKEIGATHTQYKNFHGMPDSEHYTTARDLSIIARYAMVLSPASEKFRGVVSQSSFTLGPTNKHTEWYGLRCTNKLRDYHSAYFDEVLGVKTGYIDASGHNFVSCVKGKDGKRLLSVISGIRTFNTYDNIFYFTRKLLEYGYKNNATAQFNAKGSEIGELDVANQPGGMNKVKAVISDDVKGYLPIKVSDWKIEKKIKWNDVKLAAPLKSGIKVGTVSYYMNDHLLDTSEIITQGEIPLSFEHLRSQIMKTYVMMVIILLILIYLISMFTKSNKRKRSVRNVSKTP